MKIKKYIKNVSYTLYIRNEEILNYDYVIYLLIINKKYYIGKTKRNLKYRLNEHVNNIINYNDDVILIILDKCFNDNDLAKKEKYRIKQYGNKILKRYFKTKKTYDNPLIFSNIKQFYLNKVI